MTKCRRYIKVFIIMLISISMLACGKSEERKGGGKEMKEDKEMINREDFTDEVQYFHALMKQDEYGDGKSVYWDGSVATLEEDEFDRPDIDDGRYVIEGSQTIKIPLVFELTYTNALEDVVVENDDKDNYHIEAKNFDICVNLIDYESEKEKMDSDSDFVKIKEQVLSEDQTRFFKKYELYRGIVHTTRGDFAGYSLILDSSLDDRAYRVTCSGIGCLSDIKMQAIYIMNYFDVLFY